MSAALQLSAWIGAALSLGAYAAVSRGRIAPQSPAYCAANLAAAVLIGWPALVAGMWGYVALNLAWGAIAARGLRSRR